MLSMTVTGCPTRTSVVGTFVHVSIIRYSSLLIDMVPQFPRIICPEHVSNVSDVAIGISAVRVQVFDIEFPFPAVFVAVSAAMLTMTVPLELTTTSNVYAVPDPAKLLATGEPSSAVPVTVISSIVKSLVDVLKVAV